MACMSSPSMTPALPGAWASNWTLSRTYHATSDNTPKLPSQDLDGIRNENICPAILEKHTLSMGGAEVILTMSERDMSDVDDDLNNSEDFYSFVSHGSNSSQDDTDMTLFPSSLSITRADPSDGTGLRELRVADSHSHSGNFDIKELQLGSPERRRASASAAALTQDFETGAEGPYFDEGVDASSATCEMDAGASAGRVPTRDESRKRVCHSLTGASMDQHFSATSDNDIPVEEQDGLVREEDIDLDNCSEHSVYTADGAQVRQSINRLSDAGESSRESVESSLHSSRHRDQRRNGANNRPGALHSILHLTQPSGDSPWTLFLDSTQPSNGLNSLSRQSSRTTASVSRSDESSIAFNNSQMHAMISDDHVLSPSYRQSPAARVRARYYDEDYEIRTIPRYQQRQESEYSSSYSSPQAYSFPTVNTASSLPSTPPFIVYAAHNGPPHAKASGVVQKTKALCSRFMKFVTRSKLNVPPPPAIEYNPFLRRNAMDLAEHDVSPPSPYLGGRPSLSLNGYQGFQRTTKASTVSVPPAPRVGHRRMDAVDVHRAYELSDEEDVVKNIKAIRRLSLPVFTGTTSGSSRSGRFSTFRSIRRPRLSINSARHID